VPADTKRRSVALVRAATAARWVDANTVSGATARVRDNDHTPSRHRYYSITPA
jgi:hypothetical protein